MAHGFQESKPEPQALESCAESLAWPGFSQPALAGLSLQAKASTSLLIADRAWMIFGDQETVQS
jgi:hypothetical protein